MNNIEISNSCPNDWNEYLKKNKFGTIYQTKEYANYLDKWRKKKPIFLRILSPNGEILLQNLLFENTNSSNKLPRKFNSLLKLLKKRCRWYYGPVYLNATVIDDFFDFLRKSKYGFNGNFHPLSDINNFKSDCKKTKWSTFLINLKISKDELYSNLSKNSARKNIDRALDRGVIIEEINDNNWKDYLELLKETRLSQNKEEVSDDESNDFWNILKKVGFSGFIAKKDQIPLSGLTFSHFNNYINEWGVARSKIDYDEKLYSQDLIKWKIIEWGHKNQMDFYDLSGVNPVPTTEKEKGILQYKSKWGGQQFYYWNLKR